MNYTHFVSYLKKDNDIVNSTICKSFDEAFQYALLKKEEVAGPVEIYEISNSYATKKLVCFFHGKL